jgi:linoleoyl-CoA desaturase
LKPKGRVKFTNKDKSRFYNTLRANIDAYFVSNNLSKHANSGMVFKTIILLSAYIVPYFLILGLHLSLLPLLLSFAVMGFAMAGIGMAIMHDANHGAYSSNNNVNKMLGYTLNMLGNTVYNWKLQHNVLHHTFTNIHDMDDDLDGPPALRFSPHHPLKPMHKYQHIYVFFFYSLLTINWVLVKDVVQLVRYRKNGVDRSSKNEYIKKIFILAFSKIAFLFYILAVPCLFFGYSFLPILTGVLLMHMISGLILSITFQLAHSVEHASFPLPNDNSEVENDWAIHQVNTTVDFARNSAFLNWYLGGLNYQVEHHLFPTICHVHYKALSEIVKETAEEHGIQYNENLTLGIAIRSHLETLKRFGAELSPVQPNPAA